MDGAIWDTVLIQLQFRTGRTTPFLSLHQLPSLRSTSCHAPLREAPLPFVETAGIWYSCFPSALNPMSSSNPPIAEFQLHSIPVTAVHWVPQCEDLASRAFPPLPHHLHTEFQCQKEVFRSLSHRCSEDLIHTRLVPSEVEALLNLVVSIVISDHVTATKARQKATISSRMTTKRNRNANTYTTTMM